MSISGNSVKQKFIIVTQKEIEDFNKNLSQESTINWFLEKILSFLPSEATDEIKDKTPKLEPYLYLNGQYLYKFSFAKASKDLQAFLDKFYIIQL